MLSEWRTDFHADVRLDEEFRLGVARRNGIDASDPIVYLHSDRTITCLVPNASKSERAGRKRVPEHVLVERQRRRHKQWTLAI